MAEAVDDLAVDKVALEVRGHEIDAPDITPITGGVSKQSACRGMPEGLGECLVVIYPLLQSTSLHT